MDGRAGVDSPAGRRYLGSISAEHDNRFAQHFVESPEFAMLLQDGCMIVTGAKGSGKTAVMRALGDIYAARYAQVHAVKLDGLRFGPLFAALQKLHEASNQGLVAIARSAWQNVIAIYVLEGLLDSRHLETRQRTDVRKYLRETGHLGTPATDKFAGHLERIWRLIAKWSREHERSETAPLLGLTPRQQGIVSAFPSDEKLDGLLKSSLDGMRKSGKRFLLCFDGLDSVVEYSIDSRDYIFAGLIDAVYKSATHPLLIDCLSLKVLIPKELAHGARRRLRDLDKQEQYFQAIHWNESNLAEFLRRRMEEHTRVKNRPFAEVWREYFPDRVRNDAHGVDEDTYHYLLRHTLYRPRQLLLHAQSILNAWDARTPAAPFKVDPTFIPRVVGETNYRLAEYFVNELVLDFPNLEAFLKSFRGLPSVMPWSEIPDRLQRYLRVEPHNVEEAFMDLYNYGLFGLLGSTVTGDGRRGQNSFRFAFMTPNVERHVVGTLTDRSLVALAPMFVEYCGCKVSPVGVVQPSA
jgi:hypothetical protein